MEIEKELVDPMDLLIPEVSINETDPLMIYNESETPADKTPTEINHNNDVQEIIDLDDESEEIPTVVNGIGHKKDTDFKPGQIPDPYSEEEQAIYSNMFKEGQQNIEFYRLHCTACNAHLGSAPYDQAERYIHPLLKVLMCKSCFDFYGSGDFDKDEDGSELYCRWCGQGGKVLCCAVCPYVFCQKCIRVNQGKKALDAVLQSEDWTCFVCNPQQIMRHRIICRALYDYVVKQLKYVSNCDHKIIINLFISSTWRPLNRPDILEMDKSLCCRKSASLPKRKSIDESFKIDSEKKIKKKKIIINPLSKKITINPIAKKLKRIMDDAQNSKSWETNLQDEVVCTPDLHMMMDYGGDESVVNVDQQPEVATVASFNLNGKTTTKLDNPTIKKFPALKKLLSKNQKVSSNVLSTFPEIKSAESYEWFNKTTQTAAKVNQNLTSKICLLSNQQESITTINDLTKIHNDLQNALGDTIQALTDIRKTLRSDFILDLKKLKFVETVMDSNGPEQNTDDNDVIIIDSSTPAPMPIINLSNEVDKTSVGRKHGYIKVKPPSQLLAFEVLSAQDASSQKERNELPIVDTIEKPVDVQETSNNEVDVISDKVDLTTPNDKSPETLISTIQNIKTTIPEDFVKKMARVKVVLGENIQPHSCKEYIPFKINNATNEIEEVPTELTEDTTTALKCNDVGDKSVEVAQVNGFIDGHVSMVT
ncbi:hypothetical protein FQR65_LT09275 [Abscondita terminalis]|nr:hypothetical protein FQR65_LT09275 [Abscondita terminalis]